MRRPVDKSHPLAGQQLRSVITHVILDALDPIGKRGDIHFRVRLNEAHPLNAVGKADRRTGGDHGFGWDAVPQVRRTSNHIALDDCYFSTEAGGVRGGDITCRAATDD